MTLLRRRPRRLRASLPLRAMVRETVLNRDDFIVPLFARAGREEAREIPSLPGQYHYSVGRLAREAKAIRAAGFPAVLLFGIPSRKDARGTSAWAASGIIQQAVKAVKDAAPDLTVITDVCLCEYTDHGHCGLVRKNGKTWDIDNDATLPLLGRTAVSHAAAGADVVAPSGMMDGSVAAIRSALDGDGRTATPILAYSAKYASVFYGPFRDAAQSSPRFGDRSTYQMDPANADEAMREIALDLEEGADVIMVKPALAYLDVLRRARERFDVPLAAYNVSGEYSMIKAAAEKGWLNERQAALEVLTAIKRAGADLLVTYFARELSDRLGP
ncbi:MAG: porphobilinogen synthase [Planctomycetes bacterium]|nr:porphobilinogen synthase [Planctomycetota bacterium]